MELESRTGTSLLGRGDIPTEAPPELLPDTPPGASETNCVLEQKWSLKWNERRAEVHLYSYSVCLGVFTIIIVLQNLAKRLFIFHFNTKLRHNVTQPSSFSERKARQDSHRRLCDTRSVGCCSLAAPGTPGTLHRGLQIQSQPWGTVSNLNKLK